MVHPAGQDHHGDHEDPSRRRRFDLSLPDPPGVVRPGGRDHQNGDPDQDRIQHDDLHSGCPTRSHVMREPRATYAYSLKTATHHGQNKEVHYSSHIPGKYTTIPTPIPIKINVSQRKKMTKRLLERPWVYSE